MQNDKHALLGQVPYLLESGRKNEHKDGDNELADDQLHSRRRMCHQQAG